MKNALILCAALFAATLLPNHSHAQQSGNSELVTVKKSDLPADLIARLESQKKVEDVKKTLQTVGEFAGIGKEIGVAVNEGLGAVTDQASKFADTTPGKFTMFLIAWKVMAKDSMTITNSILGVLVGIPLLIFVEFFYLWIWRRNTTPIRRLKPNADAKAPKEYEEKNTWFLDADDGAESRNWFIAMWYITLVVSNVLILALVIF